MKSITTPGQLLQTFVGVLEGEDYIDLNLRISTGRNPELRIEASNNKEHFPILLDLYPSRKILERPNEGAALILAPHIPAELAKDFKRNRINHADLNGRLYIKTPNLVIDKAPQSPVYRSPAPKVDWFSHKSSRLLRSLLTHPDRDWTQKELILATKVSGGLVSRIVNALENERFLDRKTEPWKGAPARYRLKDTERLLDRWKDADDWGKRVYVEQYSLLKGGAEEIAKAAQEGLGSENLAFTQWFAANLRYPYTTTPVVSAYVTKERLQGIRFGRKVDTGGNLWLLVPEDEGVFLETRLYKDFRLVSDIQIYLDLIHVGLRGPDHAEALRKWEGFNR